jgi:hypothetical protein
MIQLKRELKLKLKALQEDNNFKNRIQEEYSCFFIKDADFTKFIEVLSNFEQA